MRKSMLLAGAARIAREPSQAELRDAMLRRMGAGHILDMETSGAQVQERVSKDTWRQGADRFRAVVERETGWVRDQLEADIARHGGGPEIVKVSPTYWGWDVRMLQWQGNGIAAQVLHEFNIKRDSHQEPHAEAALRSATSRRFAKLLSRQAAQVRELGAPRMFQPAEIDLSRFRIERPVAAMLRQDWPEAAELLRKGLAGNDQGVIRPGPDTHDRIGAELSYRREAIMGEFTVGAGAIRLHWRKGTLLVFGMQLPDTLVMGCVGRPLGALLEHPLFDGSMTVTAVQPARHGGQDGYALSLKDTLGPMPDGW